MHISSRHWVLFKVLNNRGFVTNRDHLVSHKQTNYKKAIGLGTHNYTTDFFAYKIDIKHFVGWELMGLDFIN